MEQMEQMEKSTAGAKVTWFIIGAVVAAIVAWIIVASTNPAEVGGARAFPETPVNCSIGAIDYDGGGTCNCTVEIAPSEGPLQVVASFTTPAINIDGNLFCPTNVKQAREVKAL